MPNVSDAGSPISLNEGAQWTKNFRNQNPGVVIAQLFGKNILNSILNQPGCEGIRSYYAINDAGESTLVIVGVDVNGNDLTTGVIADHSWPCPNICSSPNQLNS